MGLSGCPKGSWLTGVLLFILQINGILSMSLRDLKEAPVRRLKRNSHLPTQIGCIHMESLSGDYWYASPGGSTVCGLYLIGQPDQVVEVEFTEFEVSCDEGGLVATLDGWETQGQIFPGDDDHELSLEHRYKTFCGSKPSTIFLSSQNVALIQFRVPIQGQGIRMSVRFIKNERPCNVVSMEADGVYTLRNYGQKKNCSVSFLYPESLTIEDLDVGETTEAPLETRESGTFLKCEKLGRHDYVDLLAGEGLDITNMARATTLCGLDSSPDLPTVHIVCSHSVVRMVSSGHFFNSITFRHESLTSLDQSEGHFVTQCMRKQLQEI